MLSAIRLHLVSEQDANLPPNVGRAAYAALLDWIGRADPLLARHVHEGDGPKPITCSDLFGARQHRDGKFVRAGAPCSLRYTALTPDTAAALRALLLENPPESVRLDTHTLRVVAATCDAAADPWTGTAAYEALLAAHIAQQENPERMVRLHLASPTAFRSGGLTVPVPMPGLLFGSLVERWNAFSPARLSGELRRFGEEMIAISRYTLQSVSVSAKNEALRIGGVGEVTYRAFGSDRYWLGIVQVLADFARFAGVGVQTTSGMGQVRRLAQGERVPGRAGASY